MEYTTKMHLKHVEYAGFRREGVPAKVSLAKHLKMSFKGQKECVCAVWMKQNVTICVNLKLMSQHILLILQGRSCKIHPNPMIT